MSIELIKDEDEVLAVIVSADHCPQQTDFITPPDYKQQLGFIVNREGASISPHIHHPMKRVLMGTSEVLIVKNGLIEVDIYRNNKTFLTKRILNPGDIILLVNGGHGFKMLADSVMLEVKQGPYIGIEEKERFIT